MEAPPLDRKLVAIRAADVKGYSRFMERDEVAALKTLSSHRAITDDVIARHGGRIANTAGDSIIAEFGSVFDAVQAAADIQTLVGEANATLPEDDRMHFRIGINVGDVMVKDGDIFGDGVNIAARLESLAEPGGICVSRGVRDQVRRKLPYQYDDLGEQSVKNIAQPIRVFRLLLTAGSAVEQPVPGPDDDIEIGAAARVADGTEAAGDETQGLERRTELTFWTSAEESGRPADLHAYLERYPDGVFAPLARARLSEPDASESAEPQPDAAVELAFWETVRDSDNPAMFEAYLEKFPDGQFKSLAEIRVKEIK